MAHPNRGPDEWRALVYRYRGPGIGNGVRVLLLMLADHMDQRRNVSVPRSKLAKCLGVTPSEVTARVAAAKESGFLDTVVAGRPGVTAVYQGLFPLGNPEMTKRAALHGTGNPTSKWGQLGHPGVATISKHNVTEAAAAGPDNGQAKAQQGTRCAVCEKAIDHPWEVESGYCINCLDALRAAS